MLICLVPSRNFVLGKSTFINYVANYFYKGSLRRPYVAIPTAYQPANMNYKYNEYSINDRTTSKTVDCQLYSFDLHGLKFHFIDTPGVNDTGGYLQDRQNVDKVFSYIETIAELSALILILNGAVARVTINIENVLGIYRDRLPDAIYSNMIIILTNCEEHTVNFNCSNAGLPEQCSVFYMQNSAFSSDPYKWYPGAFAALQRHFDSSMRTMDRIMKQLLSLAQISTKLFKDMNDDRNRIKQQLHQARTIILELQNLEDELIAIEISAGIYAANAENFQNYIHTRKIQQTKDIPTPYHNTRCFRCDIVCHENCRLEEVQQPNSKVIRHCFAMDSTGYCQTCPDRCHASLHFHARYITKKQMIPINDIVEKLRNRYLQAKEGQKEADSKCDTLQASKKFLVYELQRQYKDVKESIQGLQKTCKDLNITTILFQFVELLEKDASHLRSSSVLSKSREFIASLKQFCDNSERSSGRPQTPRSLTSDKRLPKNLMICTKPKTDANLVSTDTLQKERLPYQKAIEFRPSKHLRLSLQNHQLCTTIEDVHNDNDQFYDTIDIEQQNGDDQRLTESKSIKQANKLQLQPDITDERNIIKHKLERENLEMLPSEKLIHFSNTGVNDSDIEQIKDELQRRCDGESVGFLTRDEQIMLCEEYATHQSMKFRDLTRLSTQLVEDSNKLTGGDPFEINRIPVKIRLQLSAINLLIKIKD